MEFKRVYSTNLDCNIHRRETVREINYSLSRSIRVTSKNRSSRSEINHRTGHVDHRDPFHFMAILAGLLSYSSKFAGPARKSKQNKSQNTIASCCLGYFKKAFTLRRTVFHKNPETNPTKKF